MKLYFLQYWMEQGGMHHIDYYREKCAAIVYGWNGKGGWGGLGGDTSLWDVVTNEVPFGGGGEMEGRA